MRHFTIFFLIFILYSCHHEQKTNPSTVSAHQINDVNKKPVQISLLDSVTTLFKQNPEFIAKGFDFPVGKPNAKGYYNAQKFGKNYHLGDDWNAVTGGNSDLGDPIYSIASGYVHFAENIGGGWGNVIRVWHKTHDNKVIESLYAHCDTIMVSSGQFIDKGQQIATIGNADGIYLAHLHFEIRDDITLPVGQGYSENIDGYTDPTAFIKANRKP